MKKHISTILAWALVASAAFAQTVTTDPTRTGVPTAGSGGGSGTVTSVGVTTANGVSCSVANATTTPNLTCSLGAITPDSVNTGGVTSTGFSGPGTGITGTATGLTAQTATVAITAQTATVAISAETATTATFATTAGTASTATVAITAGTASTATVAITAQTATVAITAQTATAAITAGTASTATALATGRTIDITGDLTYTSPSFDGSGNVTGAGTLATVNSNVGSFTNASITVNGKGLVTAASSGSAGATLSTNTFTDVQTIAESVAATSTDGQVLATTATATVGAQKWSPRTRWSASGWKTNATAGAQPLDWIAELKPVQGAASPAGDFMFSSQVNGGGYTESFGFRNSILNSEFYLNAQMITSNGSGGELRFNTQNVANRYSHKIKFDGYTIAASAGGYGFSASTTVADTADTMISRNAAGIMEFNNGSPCSTLANCRDAKLRHIIATGVAPTVGGSCGTSPTIAGGDTAFIVTVGTTGATSCTVTFGTAYANAPVCTANAQTTTGGLNMNTTTTTAVISATALTDGEKLFVTCIGI